MATNTVTCDNCNSDTSDYTCHVCMADMPTSMPQKPALTTERQYAMMDHDTRCIVAQIEKAWMDWANIVAPNQK